MKTLRLVQFRLSVLIIPPKSFWPSTRFSCYSTLRRWAYAKCRPA